MDGWEVKSYEAHFCQLNMWPSWSTLQDVPVFWKPDNSGLCFSNRAIWLARTGCSLGTRGLTYMLEVFRPETEVEDLCSHSIWMVEMGCPPFPCFKHRGRYNQHLERICRFLTWFPFPTAAVCVPLRILAAETSPSPSCTGIWTWCQDALFLLTSSKCKQPPATLGLITFSRSSLGMRAENSTCG